MRFHRFFIKDKINPKDKIVLRAFNHDSILSQWKKVFRYLAGSRVILFDGSGNDYLSIIEKLDSGEAILRVLEINKIVDDTAEKKKFGDNSKIDRNSVNSAKGVKNIPEKDIKQDTNTKTVPKVTLLMSLIKNDNFDLVLQKATELGVSQIVPIITERTIKKDINTTRSQRILVEASEQCGRSDVPVIAPLKKLSEALIELQENKDKKIGVFVCNQNGLDIKGVLSKKNNYSDIVFLIGPEGGWSPKEIKIFDEQKIRSVKISNNVLRAETAAIALLAVVLQ